jgi:hypothetical protein
MTRTGKTAAGNTNWLVYQPNAIYVDVDTSSANFNSVPNYVTSLGGVQQHWDTVGASSVYQASRTGFRIYVRFVNGAPLTPADANSYGWHVVWIGME